MQYKEETISKMIGYITEIVISGNVNREMALEGLGILNDIAADAALEYNSQKTFVGNYQVNSTVEKEIKTHLYNGEKICAIKTLQTALARPLADGSLNSIGLKEAKEAIETYADSIGLIGMGKHLDRTN
jgi:hypothetical protein